MEVLLAAEEVSATTVAWIAVAGTLLGALVGSLTGGLVDRELERRRERGRAKVGARLLRLDLTIVASELRAVENAGAWQTHINFRVRNWESYRDSLMAQLTAEELTAVTNAMGALLSLEGSIATLAAAQEEISRAEVGQETLAGVYEIRLRATKAYNAVARLAEGPRCTGVLAGGERPTPP